MSSKESRVKIFFHCSRFLSHTKNPHNHLQVKLHHAVSNYLHGPPSELTVPRHIYTRVERGVVEIPHVSIRNWRPRRRPPSPAAEAPASPTSGWPPPTCSPTWAPGTISFTTKQSNHHTSDGGWVPEIRVNFGFCIIQEMG